MKTTTQQNKYFTSAEIDEILAFLKISDADFAIKHFAISKEEVQAMLKLPLFLHVNSNDIEKAKLLIVDMINIYVSIKYHLLVSSSHERDDLLEEKVLYGDFFSGRFTKKMANEKRYEDLEYWLDEMTYLEAELATLSLDGATFKTKLSTTIDYLAQIFLKRLNAQHTSEFNQYLIELKENFQVQ